MISSPKNFREKTRKLVTLPSGLTVLIRRLTFAEFIKLIKIAPPVAAAPADFTEKDIDQLRLHAAGAIVMAAISPPFTDRDEDRSRDDLVHIDNLTIADFQKLSIEILRWSNEDAGISRPPRRDIERDPEPSFQPSKSFH
jgi:hypothetical protein